MRNSKHHYRRWCKHLRNCGLDPRKAKFARFQWNLYWDGERGVKLHDAAIWLIEQFGR